MTNLSSMPSPSENTFVELTQDGRHALYLTDEQLAIVVAVFGNMHNSGKFRVSYHDYSDLVDYLNEHKIADNETLCSIANSKVAEVAAQTEKFVLEYQNRNNKGV